MGEREGEKRGEREKREGGQGGRKMGWCPGTRVPIYSLKGMPPVPCFLQLEFTSSDSATCQLLSAGNPVITT